MKITKKFAPITIEIETAEELTELVASINEILYTSRVLKVFTRNKYERCSILEDLLERLTK